MGSVIKNTDATYSDGTNPRFRLFREDCGDLWGNVGKNGVLNKGIIKGLNAFCAF